MGAITRKEAVLAGGVVAILAQTGLDAYDSVQAGGQPVTWFTVAQAVIIAIVAVVVRNKVWSQESLEAVVSGVFVCENCDTAEAIDDPQLTLDELGDIAEPEGDHELPPEGK